MAIDTTSMNSDKTYVRVARGGQTAAYIHKDHMSIPCENEDTLEALVTSLEKLHSSLITETARLPGKKPIVRIRWAGERTSPGIERTEISMDAQRYEWEGDSERPEIWSDADWATFDRLIATGGPTWRKLAYNPRLFRLTPSVLRWIGVALDLGAEVDYEQSNKTVELIFDDWHATAPLTDPGGDDPMWLSTAVGPLQESREMDRMLADFSPAAPTLKRVHRSRDQLLVELSVPLTTDFSGDLRSLDQGRQELTAQALEAGRQAYGDLLNECVRMTLAAPPVPLRLQSLLRRHDDWVWSTRSADRIDPFQEYMLDDWTTEPSEDFLTLSHAGHGINSYGLTLSMAYGPIALMVQGAWGGAFGSPIDNGRLAELYAHVAGIVRAVDERHPPSYTAPRQRPLSIVFSNFRDDLVAHRWDPVKQRYVVLELSERDPWEPLIALAASVPMPR